MRVSRLHTHLHTGLSQGLAAPVTCMHTRAGRGPALPFVHTHTRTTTHEHLSWAVPAAMYTHTHGCHAPCPFLSQVHAAVAGSACHTHTCTAITGPESTCLAQARTCARTSWSMFPLPMGTGRREGVPMLAPHHSVAAQVSQARRAAPVSALHWGCPHQHGDWGSWVTSQPVLVLRVPWHRVPVLRVYGRVLCCCRCCGVVSWS